MYNLKSKIIAFRKEDKKDLIHEVYSIHASFLMMRNSLVRRNLTSLHRAPFLFGEEIILAELVLAEKKKTIVVNNVIIKHREHATTGLFKSKKNLLLLQESLDILYRERKNERLQK